MDFADGSRCQKTLLLCSAELLLFALNIEPFRGAAQGGIKLFQIICAYILLGKCPIYGTIRFWIIAVVWV